MLGILGGMGPLATVDFMHKLIRNTSAARDQDHLELFVHSATKIPDRTDFLLGRGPDPLPAMRVALRQLENAGARVVAIPCNTAHHWHPALQAATSAIVLHIVDAVAVELVRGDRRDGPIGVLATDGTLKAGVYQDRLARLGFACLAPGGQDQAEVMRAISLVKAGSVAQGRGVLREQAELLGRAGCRRVVMACTEIPVALEGVRGAGLPFLVDATDALARACVEKCGTVAAVPACNAARPRLRRDDHALSH